MRRAFGCCQIVVHQQNVKDAAQPIDDDEWNLVVDLYLADGFADAKL